MSAERFEATVDTMKLSKDDKVWFPRWIQRYASSLSIPKDQTLPVTEAQVIAFLREQRDRGTPAWLRLQAARAIEAYRSNILHTDTPSLDRVRQTLERIAASEKHGVGRSLSTTAPPQLPNDQEPKVIFDMRAELRLRHYQYETEKAYLAWVRRFIRHCGSADLANVNENKIREFLTELAVDGNVAASTQNQALAALLFLYQKVLRKDLAFLEITRVKRTKRLPVVLSRQEIVRLEQEFEGRNLLIFQLLYGAGLRHRECIRLRCKDIAFDEGHIVVRSGKGEKDRITVLPEVTVAALHEQLRHVKLLHERDLSDGFGHVYLPYALAKKYPNAATEIPWQFLFPSRQRSRDPRSGQFRRHHISESLFGDQFRSAVLPRSTGPPSGSAFFAAQLRDASTRRRR